MSRPRLEGWPWQSSRRHVCLHPEGTSEWSFTLPLCDSVARRTTTSGTRPLVASLCCPRTRPTRRQWSSRWTHHCASKSGRRRGGGREKGEEENDKTHFSSFPSHFLLLLITKTTTTYYLLPPIYLLASQGSDLLPARAPSVPHRRGDGARPQPLVAGPRGQEGEVRWKARRALRGKVVRCLHQGRRTKRWIQMDALDCLRI